MKSNFILLVKLKDCTFRKRQLLPRTNGCKKSLHCHGLIRIGPFQRKTILLISGPAKFGPDSNFLKSVEMSELL